MYSAIKRRQGGGSIHRCPQRMCIRPLLVGCGFKGEGSLREAEDAKTDALSA